MKKFFYIFILILCFFRCSDIFDENLSEKELVIEAPPDGYQSYTGVIVFWWEYLDEADFYDLQVVSPAFGQVEKLWLDTTIAENKFQFHFGPGEYEWRVKGLNNASATPWQVRSFSVADTSGR